MKRATLPMPLASRFSLTFGLLILVIFTLVALVTERRLTRSTREQAELRVAGFARSLSTISRPALMSYDYVTLQQLADDALHEPGITGVMILDKQGLVAGCSNHREQVGRRAQDPISLRAAVSADPFEVEGPGANGERILERIEPVLGSSDARWGTIRVGLSLRPVQIHARETRRLVLGLALAGTIVALGVSLLLARRITKPLGTLVEKAAGLARGEWNLDLKIETGDEIEILAKQFAQAAKSLERQNRELVLARDDLAGLNATLEEKVRERTDQLLESQEKYRLLVEASPDPLCLMQKACFRFANRAFLETFGYTEEQVLAPNFSIEKLLHPDFARVAAEALAQAEATGEPVDTDWVAVGRGGRSLDFQVRGRRVTYQGESALELLWIDLTDKKRLLRQMVQGERLRGIGEMTTMVAHNFNNLLAVILGRAQLLQARTQDPMTRKGLETIRTAALQGGEIVKRIQEHTGESSELHPREVNVGAVLREVTSYLDNLWRVTRTPGTGPVQFDVSTQEVPAVLGSETMLAEVFKHVLLNAAEAMPNGGTVRAEVYPVGSSVRIRIDDSGVGMSPEVHRRAFDPFFTTKGSRGRGLGLSASYGIVQRHQGSMELRPREDGGTRVEITLPVHRAMRPPDLQRTESPLLLLTEEQKTARQLLQKLRRGNDPAAADGESDASSAGPRAA